MFADKSKIGARRLKRRLKAAASIAVAAVAGTFLACQRGVQSLTGAKDAAELTIKPLEPEHPDAAPAPAQTATRAVDLKEHRKGMPVPDNLLE